MSLLSGIRARLRALVNRSTTERELDSEIRFHLEQETERNLRAGMSPEEARRRARIDFGATPRRSASAVPCLEIIGTSSSSASSQVAGAAGPISSSSSLRMGLT